MLRRMSRLGAVLAVVALALSCTSDEPTAPAEHGLSLDALMARVADEDALSIDAMLTDELFQVSVSLVSEETLRVPLLAAVDALARGRAGQASSRIREARDEADVLLDEPTADFDTLISWSVIERYFEEAELL